MHGNAGSSLGAVAGLYARGLSTRDIEDAFTDEQGRCLLSRSKVSEVTEVLWEQYQAFQERDLSDFPLLCLFLDGLYEPLRTHGITREAVLCAWGITLDGRKVLISLGLGSKESGEAWLEFVRDLDFQIGQLVRFEGPRRLMAPRGSVEGTDPARVCDFLSESGKRGRDLHKTGGTAQTARGRSEIKVPVPWRPGTSLLAFGPDSSRPPFHFLPSPPTSAITGKEIKGGCSR